MAANPSGPGRFCLRCGGRQGRQRGYPKPWVVWVERAKKNKKIYNKSEGRRAGMESSEVRASAPRGGVREGVVRRPWGRRESWASGHPFTPIPRPLPEGCLQLKHQAPTVLWRGAAASPGCGSSKAPGRGGQQGSLRGEAQQNHHGDSHKAILHMVRDLQKHWQHGNGQYISPKCFAGGGGMPRAINRKRDLNRPLEVRVGRLSQAQKESVGLKDVFLLAAWPAEGRFCTVYWLL